MSLELRKFATSTFHHMKARAKLLAREDRLLRNELIAIRQRRGLTQRDVAELMGISQQAVNKFERYDTDPKLSSMRRYANAVGALVQHRVERDEGQSLSRTARTGWIGDSTRPDDQKLALVTNLQEVSGAHLRSGWSALSRTNYTLVA